MATIRTILTGMVTIPTIMLLEVMGEAVRILLFFQADKRISSLTPIRDLVIRKFRSTKTGQETSRPRSHKQITET